MKEEFEKFWEENKPDHFNNPPASELIANFRAGIKGMLYNAFIAGYQARDEVWLDIDKIEFDPWEDNMDVSEGDD